jgi:hypothetical protein
MRYVALLLLVSACTFADVAREHCTDLYCHEIPAAECEHTDDIVIICMEDRIEFYDGVFGWVAAAFDNVVNLGKRVVL